MFSWGRLKGGHRQTHCKDYISCLDLSAAEGGTRMGWAEDDLGLHDRPNLDEKRKTDKWVESEHSKGKVSSLNNLKRLWNEKC